MPTPIDWLNVLLPAAIAVYKQVRAENPNAASLTDAQVYALLTSDSADLVGMADAFLKAHPPGGPV